jgi:uncharacterized UPF0160 family protein
MLIATHDGTFHADETTACAIISYLYDNFRVIRSRDPDEIEKADLVIDVSLKNDQKHFDHHSKAFAKCRASGVRYATAGLMWEKFGIDFLKKIVKKELPFRPDQAVIDSAFDRIDREMMVMVDLVDNGQLTEYSAKVADARTEGEVAVRDRLNGFYQNSPDVSYIVAMMNLPGLSREAQDQAFMSTVRILRQILVAAAVNALTTESGIAKVIKAYAGGEILVIRDRLPWSQAVLDNPAVFEKCLLAVYPDRNGRWRVQSLPVSRALRFCNRLTAPAAWRGLQGADLDAATGLRNMNFIHRAGFTGGASTFEDDMQLAQLWLKLGEPYKG